MSSYETLAEFRTNIAKRKAHRTYNPYTADIALWDLVSMGRFLDACNAQNTSPYKIDVAELAKSSCEDADLFLKARAKHLEGRQ